MLVSIKRAVATLATVGLLSTSVNAAEPVAVTGAGASFPAPVI